MWKIRSRDRIMHCNSPSYLPTRRSTVGRAGWLFLPHTMPISPSLPQISFRACFFHGNLNANGCHPDNHILMLSKQLIFLVGSVGMGLHSFKGSTVLSDSVACPATHSATQQRRSKTRQPCLLILNSYDQFEFEHYFSLHLNGFMVLARLNTF